MPNVCDQGLGVNGLNHWRFAVLCVSSHWVSARLCKCARWPFERQIGGVGQGRQGPLVRALKKHSFARHVCAGTEPDALRE